MSINPKSATAVSLKVRPERPSRLLKRPMLATVPLFALVATVLTLANEQKLRRYGWHPLDHHGVPWPSSLAVLPYGWLQVLTFALTGVATLALARDLPRSARSVALTVAGLGLVAAMFPLDSPVGDPSHITSWVQSWHAWVHAIGFVVVGLSVPIAMAATRRRRDVILAVSVVVAVVVGGALGWYAFLLVTLGWLTRVASSAVSGAVRQR